MGLVNCPLAILDEPGSWQVTGGEVMFDAIQTAMGKANSPLKAVYIGTLAPASDGWWPQLIARGSHDSTYVQALQGDAEKWDSWPEIKRCNPLVAISKEFVNKLLEERDEARKDSRLKARFLSYRLNVPTQDESTVLLSTEDWKLMLTRPVPERKGSPIVGIDLGGGRAWSSAVAVFRSGRTECVAMAPGIPSIRDQERRDRVPQGLYERLVASGQLIVCEGLHVPPAATLVKHLRARWGAPRSIICDRFRLGELAAVADMKNQAFALHGLPPLDGAEVAGIVRSVYKRRQRKLSSGEQQRTFSFIQANRAKKGGKKRREKRADRDAAIIQAVQAGGQSMRSVERRLGLSHGTVRYIIKRGGE